MDGKQAEIQRIAATMREQHITLDDIARYLNAGKVTASTSAKNTGDIATRVFTYLGAIFILSGIGVYTARFWDSMSPFMHIFITLGLGIGLNILAVIAMKEHKYPRLITPLVVLASWMETGGWFVMIYELFPHTGDYVKAVLFVFGVMSLQQGILYIGFRQTSVAFTALFFIYVFCAEWLNYIDIKETYIAIILGGFMVYHAYLISQSKHKALSAYGYFIGSFLFYTGFAEWMWGHRALELLFPAVAISMIYVCTVIESQAILITSVLALIGFIGYYTTQHFVDSIGWPIALVIMGIAFLCVGTAAVKIKRKYLHK